jgi:hypothetical protein
MTGNNHICPALPRGLQPAANPASAAGKLVQNLTRADFIRVPLPAASINAALIAIDALQSKVYPMFYSRRHHQRQVLIGIIALQHYDFNL